MRVRQVGAMAVACVLVAAGPALAAELRAEIKQATATGVADALGTVTIPIVTIRRVDDALNVVQQW